MYGRLPNLMNFAILTLFYSSSQTLISRFKSLPLWHSFYT